jgi:5-methylcytosine-specific restriction endonuclease McrA
MYVEKIEFKKAKSIRIKKRSKVYSTALWQKVRQQVINRDIFCVMCVDKGLYSPIQDVDHITPLSDGGSKYSTCNLQGLCKSCHSSKTKKETKLEKEINKGGQGVNH